MGGDGGEAGMREQGGNVRSTRKNGRGVDTVVIDCYVGAVCIGSIVGREDTAERGNGLEPFGVPGGGGGRGGGSRRRV